MSLWRTRLLVLCLLLVVIAAGHSPVAVGFDRFITDAHWRERARRDAERPFPGDILVVAVDDRTIEAFGRLRYWSRAQYAALLDRLALASAVGIDVLFSDPDPVDRAGDEALAAAMARHGRVVIPFHLFGGVPTQSSTDQQRLAALLARLPKPRVSGWWPDALRLYSHQLEPPLPALVAAAGALGYVDVDADDDGVYRRPTQTKLTENEVILPHFAVAVAALASGTAPADATAGAPEALHLAGKPVPLVHGRLWLRPLARRGGLPRPGLGKPVPTISFVDALDAEPAEFAGKIVLVGETATGTTDIRANPLDPVLSGVELNAEILANLLYELPAEQVPLAVERALMMLAVILPVWFFLFLPPRRAMILAVVLACLLIGAMEALFWLGRMVPSWSQVLIGVFGSTLVMGLQRLVTEELRKAELRRSFSMYVAPEVVDQIADDPSIAHEQGVRQPLCVLFSDIRGFTAFCEEHEPERVVQQIGEYLSAMTEAVERYRGVLDKFIGDAVMALFGPFLDEGENESALACVCAIEMLQRLEELNEEWGRRGWRQIKIGIGLHFGDAIVGNIGSGRRMQYTALGDTVNAASRLEGLTKELGVELLVTEEVRQRAAERLGARVVFEPMGDFTVRNRARPLAVYKLSAASGGRGAAG